MRTNPTPEEELAFGIVRRELGVVLDTTREHVAPNQVDAVLKSSVDGIAFAGLEVTTLCDAQEIEAGRLLSKDRHRWHFAELRWWWTVSMPGGVRLDKARKQLPAALRLFEQNGISHPTPNPYGPQPTEPALRWFVENEVWAQGFTNVVTNDSNHVRAPGSVMITGPAIGGFTGNLNEIPPWISIELRSSPLLRSKLDKLQRSGFEEQHLFLFVDISGAPFSVVDPLASDLTVPTLAPDLDTITHLWLFPTYPFSQTVLTWQLREWRRVSISSPATAPPHLRETDKQ